MESCDESRNSSKSSELLGKSPLTTRRMITGGNSSGGEQAKAARFRYIFSAPPDSPAAVNSGDVHEDPQTAAAANDSYMTSMDSSSGLGNVSESSGGGCDEIDGHGTVDIQRTKAARERLQNKIRKTLESIQVEQTVKEDNVNEYLRLYGVTTIGDKSVKSEHIQRERVKTAFECKNMKSTQNIERLQRKLEDYQRRLNNVEHYGVSTHKQAKDLLKDVGQGLKDFFVREPVRSREASPNSCREPSTAVPDKASGFSGSLPLKSKETPTPVLKHQYGSADNITYQKARDNPLLDERGDKFSQRPNSSYPLQSGGRGPSDEDDSSAISDSVNSAELMQPSPRHRHRGNTDPTVATTTETEATGGGSISALHRQEIEELLAELHDSQEHFIKLKTTVEELKIQLETETLYYRQAVDEEHDRCDQLQDQINDLTELHQNEVTNIKQELTGMQEKMEYQLEERTRDMQELLESCQTKITKMELQQQQQQLISMEGIENSNFRAVLTKLINVMLALLAVILVTVSTIASLLAPFLTSRLRIVSTAVAVASIVIVWQNWPVVSHLIDRFFESFRNRTE